MEGLWVNVFDVYDAAKLGGEVYRFEKMADWKVCAMREQKTLKWKEGWGMLLLLLLKETERKANLRSRMKRGELVFNNNRKN